MTPYQTSQYKAYSVATGTVAKTRQVVMLYDNIIKLLRQAEVAITEKNIEDRYARLKKASDTIVGLQSSIDFDKGGEIANILHNFYTGISMRMVAINFVKDHEEAKRNCMSLIEELKQMRDVWDTIDRNVTGMPENSPSATDSNPLPSGGIVLSV